MDTLDKKILECLQKNARQSASDIGKTIHLSVSTVIDRIRKLEASGIIQHYTAVLDEKKLGNDVTALMEVMKRFRIPVIYRFIFACSFASSPYNVSAFQLWFVGVRTAL